MKYVIGIDSGGTKFLARACTLEGKTLGEWRGLPCSHYDLGIECARERILQNLLSCLKTFSGRSEDCCRIVCGTTGYDSPEDGEILRKIYDYLDGFTCPAECMNDVELAHYAVTGGQGILVLSGTGSISFGVNRDGEKARVGGWSKGIMGDEGSGRYIDALALRHYSRFLDGCRARTMLADEIEKVCGPLSRKALMDLGTEMVSPPWISPGLTPAVARAAEAGDGYAAEILREAAEQLFSMADDLIRLLHMGQDETIPLGIWGGVLTNVPLLQQMFFELCRQKYPQCSPMLPVREAVDAAVKIALLHNQEAHR